MPALWLPGAVRIIFSCRPAHGHVFPLLPLAMACREAGHDVLFATGESFAGRLSELGFPVERVGISIVEAEERTMRARPELRGLPREERWRLGVAVFADVLPRATIDDLRPLLRQNAPDLVVYDEIDLGGPLAAALAGIPAAAHALGRQPAEALRTVALGPLAEVWRAHAPDVPFEDPFAANAYLDICPASLRDPSASEPAERVPLRAMTLVGPGDAPPPWVAAARSRPLVYLTLGTYVHGHVESLRAAVTGLGALEVDVLVTVGPEGDPDALGPLPASIRAERFVPQGVLLPHVDVVAHHGGSGTMLGALAHGLPQLALPHGADQFQNAEALVERGAGRRLLPEEITPDAVAQAVRALLAEPRYRDAAAGVAAEIAAMPAPSEVVPALERLAAA